MPITTYQGGKFDDRTLAMYHETERLLPFDIFVSQGGFNAGGVAASAGTHDRAAVDVSGSLLTPSERTQVETNLRRVGFAAWVRTPAQGFTSYHIHGVPVNGDTSPAARAQCVSYLNGNNGLAGNGPDPGTRAYVGVTWESYNSTSAYRPPVDLDPQDGPPPQDATPKDWFDMATPEEIRQAVKGGVTDALRGEGVSGAADRSKNGVGESTRAIHELDAGNMLLALKETNVLLTRVLQSLTSQDGAPKPYVDSP